MSDVSLPATTQAEALRQFAVGLRWRYVRGRALSTGLRATLALAIPAVLLMWLVPAWRLPIALVVAAVVVPLVLYSSLLAWGHGRHVLRAFGDSLRTAGSGMAGVCDELSTWLELDARGERTAAQADMMRWLERDVREHLAPHEQRALQAVARPTIGRWRWILPVLLLVLLAWLLSLWWQPPWAGALGGAPSPSNSEQGPGDDGQQPEQQPGEGGREDPADQPGEQPDEQSGEQPEPAKPVASQPEPQVTPEAPAPLLDVPEQRRFVLPEFIGDGPTRRARMRAAEIEEQVGGAAPPPSATAGNNNGTPEPPPARRETFERAAEQALRSRHVPERERAIVKRFFEALQQAGGK